MRVLKKELAKVKEISLRTMFDGNGFDGIRTSGTVERDGGYVGLYMEFGDGQDVVTVLSPDIIDWSKSRDFDIVSSGDSTKTSKKEPVTHIVLDKKGISKGLLRIELIRKHLSKAEEFLLAILDTSDK